MQAARALFELVSERCAAPKSGPEAAVRSEAHSALKSQHSSAPHEEFHSDKDESEGLFGQDS